MVRMIEGGVYKSVHVHPCPCKTARYRFVTILLTSINTLKWINRGYARLEGGVYMYTLYTPLEMYTPKRPWEA